MTQGQLAAQIGWRQSQVGRIEAGYHELQLQTFIAYINGLGLRRFDFSEFV